VRQRDTMYQRVSAERQAAAQGYTGTLPSVVGAAG
jgi:hypothetical protein